MKLKEFARKMAAVGLAVSVFGSLGISAFAETADEFETGVAEINTISVETSSAIEENGVFCWDLTASAEEIAAMSGLIKLHGFGGNSVSVRPLLDAENQRKYLLAVSENGHLIAERGSYRFCQCGDGNPFAGYENYACYYGGPLCYFVADDTKSSQMDRFINLLSGEETGELVTLDRRSDDHNTRGADTLSAVTLSNNYNYIRRRAFGYNDDSTCPAVATGIALNYISLQENMRLVADYHISEIIVGVEGRKEYVIAHYPKAYALHRHIVGNSGMAPVSWGYGVTEPISNYIQQLNNQFPASRCYHFSSEWTLLPKSDTIRDNIVLGKPVLITTTIAGDYSLHTMCVYGHRRTNGENELLVHTGWWHQDFENEFTTGISGENVKTLLWIDESYATYGYYFNYTNPLKTYVDSPAFTDYSYEGILYCVKNGIMVGTKVISYFPGTIIPMKQQFSPSMVLTRAQMVQTMYAAAGKPSAVNYPNPFTGDVTSDDYFYDAVRWAYQNKLVAGTDETHFSPNAQLTREQLAVMMFRFAQYQGKDTSNRIAVSLIKDWDQVSDWAYNGIRWAAYEGLLTYDYVEGRCYRPSDTAKRSETAYAIYFLYEKCK